MAGACPASTTPACNRWGPHPRQTPEVVSPRPIGTTSGSVRCCRARLRGRRLDGFLMPSSTRPDRPRCWCGLRGRRTCRSRTQIFFCSSARRPPELVSPRLQLHFHARECGTSTPEPLRPLADICGRSFVPSQAHPDPSTVSQLHHSRSTRLHLHLSGEVDMACSVFELSPCLRSCGAAERCERVDHAVVGARW